MREGKKRGKKRDGERENNEIKFLIQLIRFRAKATWSKTAGEYPMGFKLQTSSEQIEVPVGKYGNNHDTSPN